jgi:hypothetical protein
MMPQVWAARMFLVVGQFEKLTRQQYQRLAIRSPAAAGGSRLAGQTFIAQR